MNLNHVHLGTKDLEKFINFYGLHFGFKKKFDHGKGAFLANSSGFLIAVDPVDTLPQLPEWYHLGFCLDSEAEVLSLHQKMKKESVTIVRDLMHAPEAYASFFIVDPDGNKIEISWHAED